MVILIHSDAIEKFAAASWGANFGQFLFGRDAPWASRILAALICGATSRRTTFETNRHTHTPRDVWADTQCFFGDSHMILVALTHCLEHAEHMFLRPDKNVQESLQLLGLSAFLAGGGSSFIQSSRDKIGHSRLIGAARAWSELRNFRSHPIQLRGCAQMFRARAFYFETTCDKGPSARQPQRELALVVLSLDRKSRWFRLVVWGFEPLVLVEGEWQTSP